MIYRLKLAAVSGALISFVFILIFLAPGSNLIWAPIASPFLAVFQGVQPAWAAYLAVVGFAAALGAVGCFVPTLSRWTRTLALLFAGAALIALVTAAGRTPYTVERAQTIAGNAPYCIQVANRGSNYRPAEALLDLSELTLWATAHAGMFMQFHAVLAVGEGSSLRLFNWSHRRRDWMALPAKRAAATVIHCRAGTGFAQTLPTLFPPPTRADVTFLRLRDRSFAIPLAYQPSTVSSGLVLIIVASTPEFMPLEPPCAAAKECVSHWISIYLDPKEVMSWLDSRAPDRTRVLLDDGTSRTHIECGPAVFNGGLNCVHVFLRNGLLYRFHQREGDLPNWRAIQERLVAVVRSFQRAADNP